MRRSLSPLPLNVLPQGDTPILLLRTFGLLLLLGILSCVGGGAMALLARGTSSRLINIVVYAENFDQTGAIRLFCLGELNLTCHYATCIYYFIQPMTIICSDHGTGLCISGHLFTFFYTLHSPLSSRCLAGLGLSGMIHRALYDNLLGIMINSFRGQDGE